MSGIGNKIASSLTALLGREVSEEMFTDLSFETIKDDSVDADELSDAELYELAQKLLEKAEKAETLDEIKQYQEIAEAIFEAIASHEDALDIEEDEKDTELAEEVREFVDVRQAIEEDLKYDDEIDNVTTTQYLDSVEPERLGEILSGLSPEEQANIITYYQEDYTGDNKQALLDAAINAIPLTQLDDVVAVLYDEGDEDPLVKEIIEKRLENADTDAEKQNIVKALFDRDSVFGRMASDDRADLVATMVEVINSDDISDDDQTLLETAFRIALNEQSDFMDDIRAADPSDDSVLDKFLQFLDNTQVTLSDISVDDLENSLEKALNDSISEGTRDAEGLVDDIISGRGSTDRTEDIKTSVTTKLEVYIDNDASPPTLDKAALKDFFDEILSNNSKLTNEEYKAVLEAINEFADDSSFKEDIQDAFQDAFADVIPQSLTRLSDGDIFTGTIIPLDSNNPLQVKSDDLGTVKTILDNNNDTDAEIITALQNQDFDVLMLALNDNSLSSSERELVEQAIINKALEKQENLKEFHQMLQFFPDLLDNFDVMADNNPNHPIIAFLTSPYDKNSDYINIYGALKDQATQFLEIFSDAVSDDTNEVYVDLVKLSEAQSTLYTAWNDASGDDEKAEIFEAYFDGGGTFADLTNLNSDFYKSFQDDYAKEQFFGDMVYWLLNNGNRSQKEDLFNSIEAFSEIHLALIKVANDILARDPDSDLGKALEDITNDIADGNDVRWNDIRDVLDSDEENLFDYMSSIFTYIDDFREDSVFSDEIKDFIARYGDTINTQQDVTDFIKALSPFEAQRFFESLFAEDSLLFASGKDINEMMERMFTALSSEDIEDPLRTQLQRQFLAAVNNNDILLAVMQDLNLDPDILDAIQFETLDEIDDADINRFFNQEFSNAIDTWLNSDILEEYINQLNDLDDYDTVGIQDVLDRASNDGYIQLLLSKIFMADSSLLNDGMILAIFDWFDKSANKDQRDEFFDNLSPNSTLSKALQSLIDSETPPFDDISYSINTQTGQVTFSPLSRLVNILEDTNSEAAFLLLDEIQIQEDIQADLESAEGADNTRFRRLVSDIQSGNVNFADYFSAIIDENGDKDFSNADELIDFILTDHNFLFESLNPIQLENFMRDFINYLRTDADDELREYFFDELDTDSIIGKALVAAGLDADRLDEADTQREYKNLLGSIRDFDAFIAIVETNNNRDDYNNNVIDFMASSLRGLTNTNQIREAVDKILDFAFYDPSTLDTLLDEVLNGGSVFESLTPRQADILMTRLFDRIRNERSSDNDSLSDAHDAFYDILRNSSFYRDLVAADPRYEALADHIDGIDTLSNSALQRELNKLLRDTSLIDDFISDNTGSNDGVETTPSTPVVGDYVLDEDEDNPFNDSVIIDGYEALVDLVGRAAIRGEKGRLSASFFIKSGQSASNLGEKAAEQNMTLDEVIGLIALMDPEEAADFIEAFLTNGGGQDNETVTFLLGQLMLYQIDGDITDSHFEDIIYEIYDSNNPACIECFDGYSLLDVIYDPGIRRAAMYGWGMVVDTKTNYSDTFIEYAVEDVEAYVTTPTRPAPWPPTSSPVWPSSFGFPPGMPPRMPYPPHTMPGFPGFGANGMFPGMGFGNPYGGGAYGANGMFPGMGMPGGGFPPPIVYPSAKTQMGWGLVYGMVNQAMGGSPFSSMGALNPHITPPGLPGIPTIPGLQIHHHHYY